MEYQLRIGKPDGWWQIYACGPRRAYCLSFKKGWETGWSPQYGWHERNLPNGI